MENLIFNNLLSKVQTEVDADMVAIKAKHCNYELEAYMYFSDMEIVFEACGKTFKGTWIDIDLTEEQNKKLESIMYAVEMPVEDDLTSAFNFEDRQHAESLIFA